MYGAVHHQGDLYDCTLATIPFLVRAAAHPSTPDRAIVLELLASYVNAPAPGREAREPTPSDPEDPLEKARVAVSAGRETYSTLLGDDEPAVRELAARLLLDGADEDPGVRPALEGRLAVERVVGIRAFLVWALGYLADRRDDPEWLDELARIARGDPAAEVRLTAWTERARRLPKAGIDVAEAVAILEAVYDEDAQAAPAPDGLTDTLVGHLRRMVSRETSGRRAPNARVLVHRLSAALDDRVSVRRDLLTRLLRHERWEPRLDAIGPASHLVTGWRADYADLAQALGEQLHPDVRGDLHDRAASLLRDMFQLARPAADDLVRSLETADRDAPPSPHLDRHPPWVIRYSQGEPACGPALVALARIGDERALPYLEWVLEQEDVAADVGYVVASLGEKATGLFPLVHRRLEDAPMPRRGFDRLRSGLVFALAEMGPRAVEAIDALVPHLPEHPKAIELIGRLGARGGAAVPALIPLLSGERPVALPAAEALWRIEGDVDRVLPVVDRFLGSDVEYDRNAALRTVAALGPSARRWFDRVRALLVAPDEYGWAPTLAALALWRIEPDVEEVAPVLRRVWSENASTRVEISAVLAEAPVLARELRLELEAELESKRRHNVRPGMSSSHLVRDDERLVERCATALAHA
jgi:hypothetical protein